MRQRGRKGEIHKGLSDLQYKEARNSEGFYGNCKVCNSFLRNKDLIGKKCNNGYWYLDRVKTCPKCIYIKKKLKYKNNLSLYNATLIKNQNFTLKGRASYFNNHCRNRARIQNKEFNLDKEYIEKLLSPLKCSVTGIPLHLDDKKYNPYSPSIDRIDNFKGYIKGNIQVVCQIYNFCKNQFTDEQVKDFITKANYL